MLRQEAVQHQAGEKNVVLTGTMENVVTLETAQAVHGDDAGFVIV